MASPDVHNKSGKFCARCNRQFVKSSFSITLDKDVQDISSCLQKETVCGECFHLHWQRSE